MAIYVAHHDWVEGRTGLTGKLTEYNIQWQVSAEPPIDMLSSCIQNVAAPSNLQKDSKDWSNVWFTDGSTQRVKGEWKGKTPLLRPSEGTSETQETEGPAQFAELQVVVLAAKSGDRKSVV